MYAELPADRRTGHPFHMYDEIRAQPAVVARALDLVPQQGAIATHVARARRVFLIGAGTSFHAAQIGAWSLGAFSRGRIDAQAVQSFEMVAYPRELRPDDVVLAVSHSGGTAMTLAGIRQARESGAETVAVTGFPESEAARQAAHVLPTGYENEQSWAHTASFLAAVTTLIGLANGLAGAGERLDLGPLPEVVREALALEEMTHRIAASAVLMERYRDPCNVIVVGAGPNAVTAAEGVLKLVETSYVRAQAYELEQMLHGPLAGVNADTLVVVLCPDGAATERAAEFADALRAIGVTPVVLCGDANAEAFHEAHRLLLPDVPEVISPIPYVVPLQFLSYFLAVGKGTNPDLLRREDERYRVARARYR